jgi:hypothetical protein
MIEYQDDIMYRIAVLEADKAKLLQRIEKYEAALKWYAEKSRYYGLAQYGGNSEADVTDAGKRARQSLADGGGG